MILAIGLVATLSGCGPSDKERVAQMAASQDAATAAAEEKGKAEDTRRQAACEKTFGDLRDQLEAISSKLKIGMNQTALSTALGDVQVAYDRAQDGLRLADDADLDKYCVKKVGLPLEDAFNNLRESNTTWRKCIESYGCDVKRDKLKGMRKKWSQAQLQTTVAKVVLKSYTPYEEGE